MVNKLKDELQNFNRDLNFFKKSSDITEAKIKITKIKYSVFGFNDWTHLTRKLRYSNKGRRQ